MWCPAQLLLLWCCGAAVVLWCPVVPCAAVVLWCPAQLLLLLLLPMMVVVLLLQRRLKLLHLLLLLLLSVQAARGREWPAGLRELGARLGWRTLACARSRAWTRVCVSCHMTHEQRWTSVITHPGLCDQESTAGLHSCACKLQAELHVLDVNM